MLFFNLTVIITEDKIGLIVEISPAVVQSGMDMKDYIVLKDSNGITLENGNTVYMMIHWCPSVDAKGRIVDIGVSVKVNKAHYHSSLMAKIDQLVREANEELLKLNLEFADKDIDLFNSRASRSNAAQ
jgi:hypothetical protein